MEHNNHSPLGCHAVLDSLADGVYVTDTDRHIVMWNQAAQRITGWTAEDLVGRSCFDDILCHEDVDGNRLCGKDTCPLHRSIETGESSTLPQMVFARTKAGKRIPVEVSVAPVRDPQGEIIGGVESFRDLSPLLADLHRASVIQDHAMMADRPDDPRLTIGIHNAPQEFVSGDFCRVERIGPDLYAILVADVMGHGISAALYTMQIRSLWEESRPLLGTPAAFAMHVNEKLFALTLGDDFFATAFYGVLDVATGSLTYVLAGHPPPLIREGDSMFFLPPSPVALGLFADTSYESHTVSLADGDMLLVYTDGVVEASDPAGHELGQEGLRGLVHAADHTTPPDLIPLALTERLLAYTGLLKFEDDVTFVTLTLSTHA